MVTTFQRMVFVFFLSGVTFGSDLEFKTQLSKSSIFYGETVTAQFTISGNMDIVEAEVAKFPEFRGYWSENTLLRQGPLHLNPVFRFRFPPEPIYRPQKPSVVLGSYSITPMLDHPKPEIEPMKILAKYHRLNSELVETYLTSEMEPLNLRLLPKPPQGKEPLFFGGVGQFTLAVESSTISFQTNEPTTIRLLLAGDGNFPELNEIPLKFPESIQVLSKNSYVNSSQQSPLKVFEWAVTAADTKDFVVSPQEFLVFNPHTEGFESLFTPTLSFQFVPAPSVVVPSLEEGFSFREPQRWVAYRPFYQSPVYVGMNGLLVALSIWLLVSILKLRVGAEAQVPAPLHSYFPVAAQSGLQNVFDAVYPLLLKTLPSASRRMTHRELVILAARHLSEEQASAIRELFSAHTLQNYSPHKPSPTPAVWAKITPLVKE